MMRSISILLIYLLNSFGLLHTTVISTFLNVVKNDIVVPIDSSYTIKSESNSAIDSLNSLISKIDNISGIEFHSTTFKRLNQILNLKYRLNQLDTQSYVLYRKGILFWENNDKEEAIELFKQTITEFDKQHKVYGSYGLLSTLRFYFSGAGLREERLKYYLEKLKYYRESGPYENTAICYHAIAGYYVYKADYNQAISYYLKASDVYKRFSVPEYCNELNGAGQYYFIWGNHEKAKYYLQTAFELSIKIEDWFTAAATKKTLALIALKQNDFRDALTNIDESLQMLDQHPNPVMRAIVLAEKAGILIAKDDLNSAFIVLNSAMKLKDSLELSMVTSAGNFEGKFYLYKYYESIKDFGNAENQLLSAYDEARQLKSDGLIQKYRKELIHFYTEQGKSSMITPYSLDYINFEDSLRDVQNSFSVAEYENVQKEQQSEKAMLNLQLQKKEQRNIFIVGGLFLVMITIGIYSRLTIMRKTKLQMEEKNKQIEKEKLRAEQSEQFKQQFLANMSHEIRTPMNAVMGMTNLLLDKNPRNDQFHYLTGIKKSSETLLHIINDILDLSKIEAGKIELEQIDFSLPELLTQVEQMLIQKAEEKDLKIILDLDQTIPILVGDPVRLFQVLMNLTGNAIKFTEEGFVKIYTAMMHGSDSEVCCIHFSIIDTGIGIPKDKLEYVFENFSQAHASDTRKYGGTGLGLSISRQLIELLGGKISIESEEGTGTIFSFQLNFPKGSEEKLKQRIQKEESYEGKNLDGLKILIVDDNDFNLVVASDTLKLKANVDISTASNGKEAIQRLTEEDFDVILMDVQMPEMNGLEATDYIRSHFKAPKRDIPIIALTASVLRADLEKCKQAGMNAYIPKPFKASQLIRGISEVMGIHLKTPSNTKAIHPIDENTAARKTTDLTYLNNFCEGDEQRMIKYIRMFLDSAPELIDKLKTAIKQKDSEQIANQVHAFKTKWIMMGMKTAKELSEKLEAQCRQSPEDTAIVENTGILIRQLEEAIDELKEAV